MNETILNNIVRTTESKYLQLFDGQTVDNHTYDPSNLYLVECDFSKYALAKDYLKLTGGTLSGLLNCNDGLNVNGTGRFSGDIYIGGDKSDGVWNFYTNRHSLSVGGSLNVYGEINTDGHSIYCGSIDCGEINGGTADFAATTVSSLICNGELKINNRATFNNTVDLKDNSLTNVGDITVNGTSRLYGDVITYNIKPYENLKYNIGNSSKYYKNAYIQNIYSTGTIKSSVSEIDSATIGNLVIQGTSSLGTVTSGTWNASTIAADYLPLGGTDNGTKRWVKKDTTTGLLYIDLRNDIQTLPLGNISTPDEAIQLELMNYGNTLYSDRWTDIATISSYETGAYAIFVSDTNTSNTNYYSGIMTIRKATVGRLDEIALHSSMATGSDVDIPTRIFLATLQGILKATAQTPSSGANTHTLTIKINRLI